MIALSTPIALKAESTCSTVCTRTAPSPIVVARSTVFKFSMVPSMVGSAGQVFAFKFDPMINRGRLQLERHLFTSVQRSAAESGRFRQRMLKLGSHRALTNKELGRWPAIG